MTPTFSRWLLLFGVLLAGPLAAGCNTYHYYDITVTATTPVTEIDTSSMDVCQILVTGADSHEIDWNMAEGGCPPSGFPNLGAFEFASFADSGNMIFTYYGYQMNVDPAHLCTTAVLTLPANDTITQSGVITVNAFDTTMCPPHTTTTAP